MAPKGFLRIADLCAKLARCIINSVEDFQKELSGEVDNINNSGSAAGIILEVDLRLSTASEVKNQIFESLMMIRQNPTMLIDEGDYLGVARQSKVQGS